MTTIFEAPSLDAAVSALREYVAERESRGEKTLIFCEDKLTLICERGVISRLQGSMLTEVTTFARFLAGPGVLSKQGSVMLLSSILEENRDSLSCFHERSAAAVYETIAQLNASKVDEEALKSGAENTDGLLQRKLFDLSFLFSRYRQTLARHNLLDESEYLSMLPERIAESGFQGVNVIFFGFPSFTKQAQEGIFAALRCAKSVAGFFLSGKEDFFTHESAEIFARLCEAAGMPFERIIVPYHFVREAEVLSRHLFSSEPFQEREKTERVRSFSAVDEREELEIVSALIRREISMGRRYREIAVLVPGKESFFNVERCFRSYRIPYYADRKRPFSEHPFCRFFLSVLNAAADGVRAEEADEIASSIYFGEGSEYRNYLMRFGGYRGAVRREIKDGEAVKEYDRPALIACREKMLAILSLFPRRATGREYADAVRSLAELVSAEECTERLKEQFTGAEREFLDLKPLSAVLGEMETIAGDKIFSARDFAVQLKNGLSALEISMIPQSLDAVFVGDVTESRFERVKVLFVTGLTEEIPITSADAALITDGEIQRLDRIKVEIEPKIEQVNARSRESVALNLCAFEEALYLSYPLQKGGQTTEKSEILKDVERLFLLPPMPDLFPFDCCEKGPALLKLLREKARFEHRAEQERSRYFALYAMLKEEYGEQFLDRLLFEDKKEELKRTGVQESVSPTQLEKYFECPYSSFVSRVLKLKEREERALPQTDAGNFIHRMLEQCAEHFEEIRSETECRSLANKIGREMVSSWRYLSLRDTPEGEYIAGRLIREGEEVCAAAWKQVYFSRFHVQKTEGTVSIPELRLVGKPDRIDSTEEFVRVIDYKTGTIDDKPTSYYTGQKLQLQLYLKAVSFDGFRPAGAFYFPARQQFLKEGEKGYSLRGFYCGEEEVLRSMDPSLAETGRSEFFDGKADGKFSDKGMRRDDFDAFLDYALLISSRAEHEIREGKIEPSPYEDVCSYCKLKSLCGFIGEPRKEESITCGEIARIVKREKGEL